MNESRIKAAETKPATEAKLTDDESNSNLSRFMMRGVAILFCLPLVLLLAIGEFDFSQIAYSGRAIYNSKFNKRASHRGLNLNNLLSRIVARSIFAKGLNNGESRLAHHLKRGFERNPEFVGRTLALLLIQNENSELAQIGLSALQSQGNYRLEDIKLFLSKRRDDGDTIEAIRMLAPFDEELAFKLLEDKVTAKTSIIQSNTSKFIYRYSLEPCLSELNRVNPARCLKFVKDQIQSNPYFSWVMPLYRALSKDQRRELKLCLEKRIESEPRLVSRLLLANLMTLESFKDEGMKNKNFNTKFLKWLDNFHESLKLIENSGEPSPSSKSATKTAQNTLYKPRHVTIANATKNDRFILRTIRDQSQKITRLAIHRDPAFLIPILKKKRLIDKYTMLNPKGEVRPSPPFFAEINQTDFAKINLDQDLVNVVFSCAPIRQQFFLIDRIDADDTEKFRPEGLTGIRNILVLVNKRAATLLSCLKALVDPTTIAKFNRLPGARTAAIQKYSNDRSLINLEIRVSLGQISTALEKLDQYTEGNISLAEFERYTLSPELENEFKNVLPARYQLVKTRLKGKVAAQAKSK